MEEILNKLSTNKNYYIKHSSNTLLNDLYKHHGIF